MDKFVEELARIEQAARAVTNEAEKSKAALPNRVDEEIKRRTAEIDENAEKSIKRLYRSAQTEIELRVQQIKEDAERGAAVFDAAFERYRDKWRAELVKRVLDIDGQ